MADREMNSKKKQKQKRKRNEIDVIDLTVDEDLEDSYRHRGHSSSNMHKIAKISKTSSSSSSSSNSNSNTTNAHAFTPEFSGNGFKLNVVGSAHMGHASTNSVHASRHAVSLSQILDLENARSVFMSTFSLDLEWFRKLLAPMKHGSVTLVKHWSAAQGEKLGRTMGMLSEDVPIVIVHPKLEHRYSNMHAKLWMIEFDSFLRVVVTSGNLTEGDWRVYTQQTWIQDFPLKAGNEPRGTNPTFSKDLEALWNELTLNIPSQWLQRYDFSDSKADLVVSIPGTHKGENLTKFGHMRLRTLLASSESTHQNIPANTPVTYQSSSLGSLTKQWLNDLCDSVRMPRQYAETAFRAVFPTEPKVRNSAGGVMSAGMVRLQQKGYENKAFPRAILCECDAASVQQQQANCLLHSKIMLRLHKDTDNNVLRGWIYCGSHNLTPSALGRLQKNGTQLFCMNFEVGVLLREREFPMTNGGGGIDNNDSSSSNSDVNNRDIDSLLHHSFPIPFKLPPRRYRQSIDRPFIFGV